MAGHAQGTKSSNSSSPWTTYNPANARPYFGTVILHFGVQVLRNGSYGTRLFQGAFVDENYIRAAVLAFARGYYNNTPPDSMNPPKIRIIVGTSNYTGYPYTGGLSAQVAGSRWGALVNAISNDVVSVYGSKVSVSAGIDMEQGGYYDLVNGVWESFHWSDPSWAYSWTGFYAEAGNRVYYNYGAANECYPDPNIMRPNCAGAWYQDDVWYMSRGALDVGGAIPQIYYEFPSGGGVQYFMSKQWQRLSLHGYVNRQERKITFAGVQTSWNFCGGNPTHPCVDPQTGWKQLMKILNNHDPSYHGDANPPSSCTLPPNCHRTDQSSLSSQPGPNIGWSTDWQDLYP